MQIDKLSTVTSHEKAYKFIGFAVASTISLDHVSSMMTSLFNYNNYLQITPRHVTYGCHDYTISLQQQTLPEVTINCVS